MNKNTRIVTFALVPRVGCQIFVDGQLLETVPVVGHTARLAELGYKATGARYGFSASGKTITKRGAKSS